MLKRFCDIVGALMGLAFLSPVFLMVAILIKMGNTGPVFYRGLRT